MCMKLTLDQSQCFQFTKSTNLSGPGARQSRTDSAQHVDRIRMETIYMGAESDKYTCTRMTSTKLKILHCVQ